MILPHADEEHALGFCERIRETVAHEPIDCGSHSVPVTVSIGLRSTRCSSLHSVDALLSAADTAMYRAKRLGRNRVCT